MVKPSRSGAVCWICVLLLAAAFAFGTGAEEAYSVESLLPSVADSDRSSSSPSSREGERSAAQDDPPNIVLFYIDDLGWSDLGYTLSRYYETPHIDRLAEQGMVFRAAYSNGPNCAPSRASLMSGQYTPRHGVFTVGDPWRAPEASRRLVPAENSTTLPLEKVTIPEALDEAGYTSAFMGKWHLGEPGEAGPLEQGFDVNIGGTEIGHPPTYFSPYRIETLEDGPEGEYLTSRLTEEALTFLEENHEDPFFLDLSHYAVHTPLQAPDSMVTRFEGDQPWLHQDDPTYKAMVHAMDRSVGRVVQKLKELGEYGTTVIVFKSDNGGLGGYPSAGVTGSIAVTDNHPLKGGKGQLYEGGIRVPMFVVWPGVVEPGTVAEEPVIGTDLYPTFLEIAGVEPPEDQPLDGKSLLPLLEQEGSFEREALYWHFPAYLQAYGRKGLRTPPAAAVRKGDWKLIWFMAEDRLELYDLGANIGEVNNLADERPEKAEALYRELRDWIDEVGGPIPEPNPAFDRSAYFSEM